MRWIWFILFFVLIEVAIGVLFQLLGIPSQWVDLAISLLIGFIFAYLETRGDPEPFYRNLSFHRRFAFLFIALLLLRLLFSWMGL